MGLYIGPIRGQTLLESGVCIRNGLGGCILRIVKRQANIAVTWLADIYDVFCL